jgi:hypothetical protein
VRFYDGVAVVGSGVGVHVGDDFGGVGLRCDVLLSCCCSSSLLRFLRSKSSSPFDHFVESYYTVFTCVSFYSFLVRVEHQLSPFFYDSSLLLSFI